ncbi:MAG TPA: response regulator [Solirubrobacterales bacterium]|jgi:CheY-like chemotaxis protein|nr:response regulator [Solirubrobacterales bacterium]
MTDPVCRLLLIEDDPHEAVMIEQQCCPDSTKVAFELASNATDAEDAIKESEFDLVICDLALPADARRGDPDVTEGQRLFQIIREQVPGTPVYILSGNLDLHMVREFFAIGGSADLYGARTEEPLVNVYPKEDLPSCVDAVQAHIAKTGNLDGFPLECSGLELGLSEERSLKIYARTQGASAGVINPLDGGLSDAKTLKLELTEEGAGPARTVAKLGSLSKVRREAERFELFAPHIPLGLGAHLLYVVKSGAGKRGALIYEFASDYTAPLAAKLIIGEGVAGAKAAGLLRAGLTAWKTETTASVSLTALRRALVSDMQLRDAGVGLLDERGIEVDIHETRSHRDMHGFNVLVNRDDEPTLIDYAEVGKAPAALDPLTLELSIHFHPGMGAAFAPWPSIEQARAFLDLDLYLKGCPIPEFVRECRAWAVEVAAEEREILASAYAYSMRQAKYGGSTQELAVAFAEGAHAQLGGA